MTKTMKVLSVIDILLTVFLMIVYIQFVMTQRHSNDGGWADLGFFLVLFVFLVIAVILTIPFIVISIRKQFKGMRFYIVSHLCFVGVSVSLFVISIT